VEPEARFEQRLDHFLDRCLDVDPELVFRFGGPLVDENGAPLPEGAVLQQ
jgi:hypothetical protein